MRVQVNGHQSERSARRDPVRAQPHHTLPGSAVPLVLCAPFYLDNVLPKANKALNATKKATNSCHDEGMKHFWGFMVLGIPLSKTY